MPSHRPFHSHRHQSVSQLVRLVLVHCLTVSLSHCHPIPRKAHTISTDQTQTIEEIYTQQPPLEHTHSNNYNLLGPIWITIHDRTIHLFPNGIGFKLSIFPHPLSDTTPLYETNINFGQAGEIDQPPLIPNNAGHMNTPYTLPIGRSAWVYAGPLAINLDTRTTGVHVDVYASHLDTEPVRTSFVPYDHPDLAQPAAPTGCPHWAHLPDLRNDDHTITVIAGPLTTHLQLNDFHDTMQAFQEIITVLQERASLHHHLSTLTLQEPYCATPIPNRDPDRN